MSKLPPLSEGQIEALAKLLGDCGSGSDISRVLKDRDLEDDSGESTKWRRLYSIFLKSHKEFKSSNRIFDFIKAFLAPARFVGQIELFEARRGKLNEILAFSGIEFGKDGQFRTCEKADTLEEAEKRVQIIQQKFRYRQMHSEVQKYCRKELMQENYFHAVFEASKGLAQRIRDMSGVQSDGASLVDKVFAIDNPILAFNTLQTDTEQSEHKGFAALLKGCFAAARNPLAHEPKILWKGEDDAADWLSLISLLHRKLDGCFPTGLGKKS